MSRIQTQLADLHRQLRKTLVARGLSWSLIAILGGLFCAGFLDWWLHVPGLLRLIFGLAIVVASGWTIWRRLLSPLLCDVSDVDLALKIERRFPGFKDSLASTVQFEKEQADPRLGSPQLQRKVIRETEEKLQRIDLHDVIETRGVKRAAFAALCLSLFVVTICGLNRADANRAFYRLKYPFSENAQAIWPQKTMLKIFGEDLQAIAAEPPMQIVEGETVIFYVENAKGDLPKDTVLEVKYPDGEVVSEKLQRVTMSDDRHIERKLGVVSLLLDSGPLKFRAVGGDDRKQKWRTIRVIPAPRIESLQVTLIPPKYISQKEKSLPKNVGRIRQAWIGTTVRVEAQANTPLKCVYFHFLNDEAKSVQLTLAKDQKSFTTTFFISKPGDLKYWFELKDLKGFGNPNAPRYTVHAVADSAPRIRLIRPVKNVRATPNAVVPIKADFEEDIELKGVEIRYRLSSAATLSARSIPLEDPESEYFWQLAGVVEGMQVRFHLRATDHFNLDSNGKVATSKKTRHIREPDVGKTVPLTIFIVSPQDKLAEISQAAGRLVSDLRRIEKLQLKAHKRVGSLLMQLQKVGRLRSREDLPLLRRLAVDQGDISNRLVKEGGVTAVGKQLLRDLTNNRLLQEKENERKNRLEIQASAVKRRLQRIIEELEDLEQQHLRLVEADLTIAWKGADPTVLQGRQTGSKKTALTAKEQIARLQTAQNRQAGILATLQELISSLSQWRDWRNLLIDVDDLIQTQENVRRKSQALNGTTEGMTFQDLKDQQKADLARLAEEQRRMKDRLVQFETDLHRFLNERNQSVSADDPVLSILTRATGYLRMQNPAGSMDDVAGKIDANHLNESLAVQTRILSELREVKSILADKETSDLETLITKQKQAEEQLAKLALKQQGLRLRASALIDFDDPARRHQELQKLIKQQETLQQQAFRWQSRLKRLNAPAAGNALRRSARRMGEANGMFQHDEISLARLRQQQAEVELELAQMELVRIREIAEAQLARELLERIADQLRGIVRRQQNVISGSERLQREVARTGRWTRERQMTLDTLHDEQHQLHSRLVELAVKTKAAEVFAHVLRNASLLAKQTAGYLQQGRSSADQ
ncbi:MAG: hypothetical protein IID45_07915, partial [Planctomycetes bacterium]|nr:hypothetical protein [Planctomycetota bacterium]